jgi:nucleoside phosphorylase
MELAALAAVCATERIPLVALKGITDLVDRHEPAHEAFVRNLARTCARLADAAPALLRALVGR